MTVVMNNYFGIRGIKKPLNIYMQKMLLEKKNVKKKISISFLVYSNRGLQNWPLHLCFFLLWKNI